MNYIKKIGYPFGFTALLLGSALLSGCVSVTLHDKTGQQKEREVTSFKEARPQGLTQVATIDSLLAGVYDGVMSFEELKKNGDFGIGTFNRLDGEMVMFSGDVYQVCADGRVYRPSDAMTTPFASVMFFDPNYKTQVSGPLDYEGLSDSVDELCPQKNIPIAVHIRGKFSSMKTRSVPAQNAPYPPLVEVTRNQPEFELGKVEGDVIGYRLPDYLKGINVPGYHLHFLSADRKTGGHILAMELDSGKIEVQQVHDFRLILPKNSAGFAEADLSRDRSSELKEVESGR